MTEEYIYDFEQILEGMDEEMILTFAGIVGVIAMVVGLLGIVGYVLQSIGLYTVAKRRGIANPWLAWLPVGYYWIAGSLADQYQYVVNGAVKNKRIILLALSAAGVLLSSLVGSVAVGGLYLGVGKNLEHFAAMGAMGTAFELIYSALELATFVFWHWSLYELYSSCDPKNNVLFLVLGIFMGFLVPFFVFACRNKELGMPPRRDDPQYQSAPSQSAPQPQPEPRTYKDPWEN